jgi:hypothetical protein
VIIYEMPFTLVELIEKNVDLEEEFENEIVDM